MRGRICPLCPEIGNRLHQHSGQSRSLYLNWDNGFCFPNGFSGEENRTHLWPRGFSSFAHCPFAQNPSVLPSGNARCNRFARTESAIRPVVSLLQTKGSGWQLSLKDKENFTDIQSAHRSSHLPAPRINGVIHYVLKKEGGQASQRERPQEANDRLSDLIYSINNFFGLLPVEYRSIPNHRWRRWVSPRERLQTVQGHSWYSRALCRRRVHWRYRISSSHSLSFVYSKIIILYDFLNVSKRGNILISNS